MVSFLLTKYTVIPTLSLITLSACIFLYSLATKESITVVDDHLEIVSLGEEWRNRSRDALSIVSSIDVWLKYTQVQYSSFYSLLLGIARHGTIIPWIQEPTLEFIIEKQPDRDVFVKQGNEALSVHRLTIVSHSDGIYLIKSLDSQLVALLYEYTNLTQAISLKEATFSIEDIFPTIRIPFEICMIPVPREYKKILSYLYGPNWASECIVKDGASIPCNAINRVPLVNQTKDTIPKIIHQAWVGNKEPPFYAIATCKKLNPNYTFYLWEEDTIDSLIPPLYAKSTYDSITALNGKADVVRWEVLHRYGGIWLDADVFCNRPLDDLFDHGASFFVGYHNFKNPELAVNRRYEFDDPFFFGVSTVGSVPGHPVVYRVLSTISRYTNEECKGQPWQIVGPGVISKVLSDMSIRELVEEGVGSYPFYCFLPYNLHEPMPNDLNNLVKIIKYDSYCWNFWGTTFTSYGRRGSRQLLDYGK
eukprot:TRINITY_DN609_c0_g2_i2.p1 TRINITY_DN609_c0_g2~~TRINITY_DN609_c0_g2_i2.p1  ORF type:complete len:475 (-),score=43.25 TRINITY_DN609_c0_g2_i2:70-1494(-)